MIQDTEIIIIGAGAAGFSAASHLIEKGFNNLLILEAKNRIGGRINTVKFSENIVELGAQWCHGEEKNIIYSLAAPHNLLESSRNINDHSKHIFVNSMGNIVSEEETIEIQRIYYKIIEDAEEADHPSGTSFGEYFTNQFYKEIENNSLITKCRAEEIINWIQSYHNSIECCDNWFDLSANRLKDYWTCDGDSLLNWKTNGYIKLFDLLSKKFPDSKNQLPIFEKILFNKEVCQIDYSFENIIVKTSDDCIYHASSVIITTSLGVLKEKYSSLFQPSLPTSKILAIQGLNIGVANKIFLEFPHRWWPEKTGGLSLMWSEDQKKNFVNTYGKDKLWLCDVFKFFTVDNQPRVLSGWIVGPNAKFIETLEDDVVINEFYFLLKKFLGHIYDIPKPQSIIRSKWFSDKHFRGSYSYQSLYTESLNIKIQDLASPIKTSLEKPIILFAGEATHEHYFSTVHGAVESGLREADRLVNYYKAIKSRL